MKVVLFIFVVIFLLFLLFAIPMKVNAKIVLDLESKSLYYSLNGCFLRLSSGKIYLLENFSLSVINESIFFMNIKQPNIDKQILLEELSKKMKIKKILLLTDAGISSDAYLTSMLVGSFNAIFESLALGAKIRDIDYNIEGRPIYGESNLNIAGEIDLSINLIKLVMALIASKQRSKQIKGEEKYV